MIYISADLVPFNSKLPLFSLHIPKSGGTSVANVLRTWFPVFYDHYYNHRDFVLPPKLKLSANGQVLTPSCVHGHFVNGLCGINDIYPEASQFITFFRDPLDQVVSLFFFQQEVIAKVGAIFHLGTPYSQPIIQSDLNQELLVTSSLEKFVSEGRFNTQQFIPFQMNPINFEQVLINNCVHVGSSSKLRESLIRLAEKMGFPPSFHLPHSNRGNYSYRLSGSITNAFYERHELEILLHEFAVSQNT